MISLCDYLSKVQECMKLMLNENVVVTMPSPQTILVCYRDWYVKLESTVAEGYYCEQEPPVICAHRLVKEVTKAYGNQLLNNKRNIQ